MVQPIKWMVPPEVNGEIPHIKTTSLSREQIFKECARRAWLQFVDKVPEPERDLGDREDPRKRGSRVHLNIEQYLKREEELCEDVKFNHDTIYDIQDRRGACPETVTIEERWNFDNVWVPCGDTDWDKIWFILKADATVFVDDSEAHIFDWKTGKKQYNEIKHAWQLKVYSVAMFMRYPDLEKVTAHMVYTDVNESTSIEMTREQGMRYFPNVNKRLSAVTTARKFPPSPSRHHCRFCPYKTGQLDGATLGTGHCEENPI